MAKYSTYFGIDSHARTTTICSLDPETGEIVTRTFRGNDYNDMKAWMNAFPKPSFGVYESGCTGFIPARLLSSEDMTVVPIATSKMPSSADSRSKKRDKDDAERLARLSFAQELKEVWVPPLDIEGLRDLSQALHDLTEELKTAKSRVQGFLTRHNYVWNERTKTHKLKTCWTDEYWKWLGSIDLKDIASQAVYESALTQVKMLEESYNKLLSRAKEIVQASSICRIIEALMCLKGVGFIIALAFAAEVGDFNRFRSGRKITSYFGFCPSERSSADTQRLGSITKHGSLLVRMLLTQGAWTIARTRPYVYKKCPSSVPIDIWKHAHECSYRLIQRRTHLIQQGKSPCKANTATAAEMARMLLYIGKEAQRCMLCA